MILVVAEHQDGKLRKTSFEAVTFGSRLAGQMGVGCTALVLGNPDDAGKLGEFGATRIVRIKGDKLSQFDDQVYTGAIAQVATNLGAKVVVMSHSSTGKALVGRVAIKWNAASSTSITSAKPENGSLVITRPTFSGKAIATYQLNSDRFVVTLMGNAVKPEQSGAAVQVEDLDVALEEPKVRVAEVRRVKGEVPLSEAELVVSAGRGMKDPGNWGIIEELAEALGAATACSRPVSDSGWRPHHEHVGQTGIAIRPNLYIAIGISGAIQHLAGVNNSKVIVVINKDPEAPFFKAADYGVEADLFDVVPKLTDAVKRFKQQ